MINIILNESDPTIINRLKKVLVKKFNNNREADIDNAVRLSNYLVAIGELSEAKNILESFLYFNYKDKPEKYQHLWPANSQGLILFAYIEGLLGCGKSSLKLVNQVLTNDYNDSSDETHFQKLLYDYRNHEEYIDYYKQESHKYRCEILCQECLTFLYWRETWREVLVKEPQRFDGELDKINNILNKTYALLKKEIFEN